MAFQLHWPNKYFFYPLGNTTAVSLTRDLPPHVPASLLLLGCGDPRNVIYTVFCDRQVPRKLDFTCCDWDLGVLARNALLFSLIIDDKPQDQLWNIFYHTYLDHGSRDLLVSQCRRLIEFAESPDSWRLSPYGRIVRFSTDHTLTQVCRFWQLYADMYQLPGARYQALVAKFRAHCEKILEENAAGIVFTRAAGPMGSRCTEACTATFNLFWKSGITAGTDASKATFLNATFIYSRGEDAVSLHYGQYPLASFNLAAAFGSDATSPTAAQIVHTAKNQFAVWCGAFRTAGTKEHAPVIRLIWGDALAVAFSLRVFTETGSCESDVFHAQWSAARIRLNAIDYAKGNAPTTFDVADTSNLTDHLGLLNLLIAIEPILATFHSVLYTEALAAAAGTNATDYALKLLRTDFPTMALLLNLSPVDYLSGFTTRSNVDEVVSSSMFRHHLGGKQFQQGLTWRRPASGDELSDHGLVAFNDEQLADLFYALYRELFDKNDLESLAIKMQKDLSQTLSTPQLETQYTYETFALLLTVVCAKHGLDGIRRSKVMQALLDLLGSSFNPMSTAGLHMQELYMHLFRLDLFTVGIFRMDSPRTGRFASWESIPDLVRIVLAVPRAKLQVFHSTGKTAKVGSLSDLAGAATLTPPVQGQLQTKTHLNIFNTVHVVFGTVTPSGSLARPDIIIHEDPKGWSGRDPLLVSFVVSTKLLTVLNNPEDLQVAFAIRMTPLTVMLGEKLGPTLAVHQASLMDVTQVHVVPDMSTTHAGSNRPRPLESCPAPSSSSLSQDLGSSSIFAELNKTKNRVERLVGHVDINKPDAKNTLRTPGSTASVCQISPCTMRLTLAGHVQDVVFPHPIGGSKSNIKIARKSGYIKIVVPMSGGLDLDGMAVRRFPVIYSHLPDSTYPWNIHRINLSDLPLIKVPSNTAPLVSWLNPHVSLAMSAREMTLRERSEKDAMMFVKDTIHALFSHVSGAQQGTSHRVFQLLDATSQNFSDTVLFVDSLRHDLASSTVICHAYLLPLTHKLAPRVRGALMRANEGRGIMNIKIYEGEAEVWKRLFPALAERCRTWEHVANCEYVAHGRIPLSIERGQDPLCSCGRGKDVEGSFMLTRPALKELAPHVTRIAISPIFSVSYLEPLRDFSAFASRVESALSGECAHCSKTTGPNGGKLKNCSRCRIIQYCSAECQKADWKSHKKLCR